MIRTEGLTKVYPGGVTAVDGLDLGVHEGEIFGLLGPNGAGKSTTAGMLTTRVIPTSGNAFVGGIDVVKHPTQAKQVIGVVPQTNTLDRSLTVSENLYFHGRFFGMSAKTAKAEADRAHRPDQAEPVRRRAGGAAVGRDGPAADGRPGDHAPAGDLLPRRADSGLDPQSRLALYEIVAELNAEGQTVLLTTHYMEEADQLCERLAIIDHGKVLALDTPADLKRSVGADTIVTVVAEGDMTLLAKELGEQVPGVATRPSPHEHSVELAAITATGILPAVVNVAEGAGFILSDLSVAEPTLETVFIRLTGKELRD